MFLLGSWIMEKSVFNISLYMYEFNSLLVGFKDFCSGKYSKISRNILLEKLA